MNLIVEELIFFCNKKISQSEDEEGEKVYVGLL